MTDLDERLDYAHSDEMHRQIDADLSGTISLTPVLSRDFAGEEVLLFRNVSNAGRVRSKVIRGELNAAIIDASPVRFFSQRLTATLLFRALTHCYCDAESIFPLLFSFCCSPVFDSSLASRNVNTRSSRSLSPSPSDYVLRLS